MLDLYMAELTKLRDENARRSEADAHTVLKEIYNDPDAPQGNRIKAAGLALNEKPRLSMTAYAGKLPDRRPQWQTYQRWQLKNEIVLTTRNPPPPGYDAIC